MTKADGSRQPFEIDKVEKTCLRMGASHQLALDVARKVQGRVYDGMPTKEVLKLIFRYMHPENPTSDTCLIFEKD